MNLEDIINNEESRLARFPIAREKIFFSHAAVTALPHCAAQAMADYAYSSCKDHQEFPEFMETMNETRRLSADLIGADFSEIALLGPTSLGLSLFAKGLVGTAMMRSFAIWMTIQQMFIPGWNFKE